MKTNVNYPAKRNEIIVIALELFLENGYDQTTLTMIMKRAQLTKQAFYHYFCSKLELLDAIIDYAGDRIRPNLEHALEQADMYLDKLMVFFQEDWFAPSDFDIKFMNLKNISNENDDLVLYRIREKNIALATPYFEAIIIDAVSKGHIKTQFPKELAKAIYLLGEDFSFSISELVGSSCLDIAKEVEHRTEAFCDILSRMLGEDKSIISKCADMIKLTLLNQINKAQKVQGE